MSLSPEIEPIIEDGEMEDDVPELRTFKIDFERNRITNEIITGIEAAEQMITIELNISRFAHSIYSSDAGTEIAELLRDPEASIEYTKMEIARFIEESLVHKDWIDAVTNIRIDHIDDEFHTFFVVETTEGVLEMREVFSPV